MELRDLNFQCLSIAHHLNNLNVCTLDSPADWFLSFYVTCSTHQGIVFVNFLCSKKKRNLYISIYICICMHKWSIRRDFAIDFLYSVPIMCIRPLTWLTQMHLRKIRSKPWCVSPIMIMTRYSQYSPISIQKWLKPPLWAQMDFFFLMPQPCLCSYSKKAVGPPPAHYTCYRCGKAGHYIRQCPMLMVTIPHY